MITKGIRIDNKEPIVGYYVKELNGEEFIFSEVENSKNLVKFKIETGSYRRFVDLFDDFGDMIFEGDVVQYIDRFELKKPVESEVVLTTRGPIVRYPSLGSSSDSSPLDRFCDYGKGSFDIHISCVLLKNVGRLL